MYLRINDLAKIVTVVLCVMFLTINSISGQVVGVNPDGSTRALTTALPFLLINPDSRGGGLGDAGVAISDNANSVFWNPAALSFTEKRYGFAVNYTPWLRALGIPDINLAYLPAYFKINEKSGVVNIALTNFSLGEINFTDATGADIGNYNANEFSFSAGYSLKITDKMSIASNLRFARSNLTGTGTYGGLPVAPAQTFAGDVAMFYTKDFNVKTSSGQLPLNLRVGMNISNIGAKVSYSTSGRKDFIPTNLRLGWALKAEIDQYNTITLTNDFNKLMVPSEGGASSKPLLSGMFGSFADRSFGEEMKEITVSIGAEYWYNKLFAVRAGWFWEDPNKGNRKFITLGAGLRFKVFTLDFAYLAPFEQNHPLQNTLRFTLAFDFE